METKICKECKVEKIITDFSPRLKGKQGVNSKCKNCCSNERVRAYKENPELFRKRAKYYRRTNPESYRKAEKKYREQNPSRKLLDGAKYRAEKKGIIFNIDRLDIIIPDFCPILGIPIFFSKGCVSDNSPSVDRIIPVLGYVKGNIKIISHKANRMKTDATLEQLENLIKYIRNGGC